MSPSPHRVAAAVLVMALLVAAPGADAGDAGLRWRTLSSDNFRLHHPRTMADLARRTLGFAEEAYAELRGLLGYDPSELVELVLFDDQDSANGLTWTFPQNMIHLYAYPPNVDEELSCSDQWMRMLLTHELLHVFHLDRTTGILRVVNKIFGKVVQPNQAWPTWFVEGLAVTLETRLTQGGRLRSPRFLEILRMASLEDAFMDLGELSGTPLKLPRGNALYLYGGFFVSWLVERHGTDWLRPTLDRHGRRFIPLSYNVMAQRAFGATFVELYDEWRTLTRAAFEAWRDRRVDEGLIEGDNLGYAGETNPRPRFLGDGDFLWVESTGHEARQIRRRGPGGEDRRVAMCHGGCSWPAEDREGRIWFVSSDLWQGYYYFKDLWSVDPRGKDRQCHTERLRCRDLAIHLGTNQAACVATTLGSTRLITVDLETMETRVLAEAVDEAGEVFGQPAWSPDGDALVYVRRLGMSNDLWEIDVATGAQRGLNTDSAWIKDPVYHPGGRWILHSAAPEGVYDIYALDRYEPSRRVQLTRVLGGAHSPAISPDGRKLVFASYHADGYHLRELDLDLPAAPSVGGPSRSLQHADERAEAVGGPCRAEAVGGPCQAEAVGGPCRAEAVGGPCRADIGAARPSHSGDLGAARPSHSGDLGAARPSHSGDLGASRPSHNQDPSLAEDPLPTPYLPFLHLRPRSWMPTVTYEGTQVTSWGMELEASDPALLHYAWLSFYHYPVSDDFSTSLQWTVDTGWPLVSLGASLFQNHGWAFQGDDWHDYKELEGLFSLGVIMPLRRQHHSFRWSLTWSLDVFDGDLEEPVAFDPGAREPWRPNSGRLASLNSGFSYNNTERYAMSIGPERGVNAALNMRFSAPWIGSEWTEHSLRFSGSWYLPLWWRQHTLAIRYRAGLAGGEPPYKPRFSLGGYPTQDYIRDLLENTGIAGSFLRGFVSGAFRGNQFQYATLDYRFPLWRIRRGYQTWPVFLNDLVGTVFVNAGYAADGFQPVTHGGLGVGAELALNMTLAFYQPLTLTLGYASGFGDGGSHGVYFLLGP